ncbi:TrkA-C domain-containing protein [Streptomyces viridosporus ATCC 14672]|uniref:TrkA-C domain-containing protein n=1 Tax=Streptomyces viridosporus (strain ATCC 14672 / DSM 40746 / JCM 4963 / KCTC 9882 / NRRL B-12104 / FH 1290) TaxID=566461 RepID=D5ZWN1_STRV1|nr:TrkA-C domain-containing protein [Streptomyces viridosporus ATCC 14672]
MSIISAMRPSHPYEAPRRTEKGRGRACSTDERHAAAGHRREIRPHHA